MEAIDLACFGEVWGPLGDREWALLWPLLGYAIWAVVPGLAEAELMRLAVDPAHRRRGLGRRLLEGSELHLMAEGVLTLLLEVRVGNTPARGAYEALGWRQDGLRKAYYRDGEDAALYRKDLR